jgi:hypothetical protein
MEKKIINVEDFVRRILWGAFIGREANGSVEIRSYGGNACETHWFGSPNKRGNPVLINEVKENEGIHYERSNKVVFKCPSFNNLLLNGFIRVTGSIAIPEQNHLDLGINILSVINYAGPEGASNKENWPELEKFASSLFAEKYPQKINEQHFLNEFVQTRTFNFVVKADGNVLAAEVIQKKEWEFGFAVPCSEENKGGYLRLTTNQENDRSQYFLNESSVDILSSIIENAVASARIIQAQPT